jgi:hypothetical protein
VWPRQKTAKPPSISAQLCSLAFSCEDRFPEVVELVLPLISATDRSHSMLLNFHSARDSLIARYPKQVFVLLHAVLPDDPTAWPFGTDDMLNQISDADSEFKSDERLLELKRRWNAR